MRAFNKSSFGTIERQNASYRFLYLLYCIVGGMYVRESRLDKRLRYGWTLLTACSLFLLTIGGFCGYFVTSSALDVPGTAHILTFSNAITYCIVLVPVVSYNFRRELETAMEYTSAKYTHANRWRASNFGARRKVDVKTIGAVIFAFQTAVAASYVVMNVVLLFAQADHSFTSDVKNYLGPVPYVERVETRRIYLAILLVQVVLEVPPIVVSAALPAYIVMMGCGLHNASVDLFSHSTAVRVAVERVESTCHTPPDGSEEGEILRRCRQLITDNVRDQVRGHQEFVRTIKLFLPYLEIFSSVQLVAFFVTQLPNAYIILLTNPPSYMIFRQMLYMSLVNVCLFATCYVGMLLDNINADFRNEIYSLPWFNMSPEYRNVIYIFQCQAHKPLQFFSFRTSNVNLYSFVQACKILYSFINILRVTVKPN